jgi:hypothetical protein
MLRDDRAGAIAIQSPMTWTPSALALACLTFLTVSPQPPTATRWKGAGYIAGIEHSQSLITSQNLSGFLPFTLVDGMILVEVRLNGRGPFRMIFDSGATAVLSPQVAHALKLPTSATSEGSGTGPNPISTSSTSVSQVEIGPLDLNDQTFDVVSMDDMPPVFGDIRIDGIIGRPVFSRATVEVDYDKHRPTFFDPQKYTPPPSEASVPFTRVRDVPLIEASLDGQKGKFGVDLGARSSLILTASFVGEHDIANHYRTSSEMIVGWGLGGPIHAQLAKADKFEFGGFEINSPLVRLSTQKSGLLGKSETAGLIGADILRQFTITFDDAHGLIYFRPSRRFGEPTTFDKTGMWLVQDGKAFSVMEITPGGGQIELA